MEIKLENLAVKEDVQSRNKRGFYVVDTTSFGSKYLNKDGKLQKGVCANDCWWPTRKAAIDFVLDLFSEND